ncbi:MAG: alpha/beta hydrolase [Maribacter sp.]|nr:alpha/beta hydrolase [Maribacter sp.]MBT8302648.1 alpha/beta hydrolase [Maribacter sp.]
MSELIEVPVDNLIFDCRVAGNKSDELVIFLHGFPETSFMWSSLILDISKQGFYCLAPNLRGYSNKACPSGKKNYTLDKLAKDVMEIAKAMGRGQFHLVGHDWGAGIGWKVAHDYPDSILSFTGISVPHLQAFSESIIKNSEQKRMSRYIRLFQWPFFPEKMIRKNNFALFRKLWKNSSEAEIEDYLSVFRDKKKLTAALNYYRANFKPFKKAIKKQILGEINVATLFIWGEKDKAIGSWAVENGHKFIKNDYVFLKLDAGHWLIQTKYQEIKLALSEHLLKYKYQKKPIVKP